MTDLRCERCDKRLSRKTARLIDGKVICSACLFPPLGHSISTNPPGHAED